MEGALAQIATRAGMIRIDTCRGNLPGGRETIRELADREPYSRPYDLVNKPPYGFLKGMSGLTEFVTQSWQLGRARGFLSTRLEYDREAMTFIEFSIVRWLFTETGDQSTLLLTVIHSLPVWNPQRGAWGYKVQPFIRHQDAASNVTCRMLQELRKAEPSKASRLLRECWQRRLTTIE